MKKSMIDYTAILPRLMNRGGASCLLLSGFLLLMFTALQAQEIVKGLVRDDTGEPLSGVYIESESGQSTETDANGKYTITAKQGEKLTFSYIGKQDLTKKVSGTTLNITLTGKVNLIGETVIVAYGKSTKKELTGAVNTIDAETLEKQQVTSITQAIQGNAPGVTIINSGGQPGNNPTIRIRGTGSINASASPLIIVDNLPYNGNINTISEDQVESITLLKDAATSALYGSRASNGVILITTKKGKLNTKPKVSFTAVTGFSSPAVRRYPLVGAEDYMKYTWEALRNKASYIDKKSEQEAAQSATDGLIDYVGYNPYNVEKPVGVDGKIAPGASLLWDTDWEDIILRDVAIRREYGLNVSGGSDKTTYFFSSNYLDQEGAVEKSDFNRITTRLSIDTKVNNWFSAGLNTSFSKSISNNPTQSSALYISTMGWINRVSSIYPFYRRDEKGKLILDSQGHKIFDFGDNEQSINGKRPIMSTGNAYGSLYLDDNVETRTQYTAGGYAQIQFTPYLKFKSTLSYENYLYDQDQFKNGLYGDAKEVQGRTSKTRNVIETINFTNALNFNKSFGSHTLGADIITEQYRMKKDDFEGGKTGFIPGTRVLSSGLKPEQLTGDLGEEILLSSLGRLKYNYQKKYFIEGSFRRDASTRFAEGRRRGNFYSLGGSWIVSEESFLKNNLTWVSLFKIRSSYGELGNNKAMNSDGLQDYFPYAQGFDLGWGDGDIIGVTAAEVTDPSLTWEKTGSFNLGLDLAFLNSRINLTADYYNKKTKDLIYDRPLAPSTGSSSIKQNIAKLRNYGYEFILSTVNIRNTDWTWKTSLNISFDHNEIIALSQDQFISGTKLWKPGRSLYDFYIWEYAGVNLKSGKALWYKDEVDKEGKPTGRRVKTNKYEEATRYGDVGSSLPDFIGGFNTYLQYKQFDMSLLFNFSYGSKILDFQYSGLMSSLDSAGSQLTTDIKHRWQKRGDKTNVPLLLASKNDFNGTSTRFLFDNDYLRLKAITLGYNLPAQLLSKLKVSAFRIYFQGDNLWTLQSHKGLDPEQNLAGTTNYRSNLMKTYSFGIKLTF